MITRVAKNCMMRLELKLYFKVASSVNQLLKHRNCIIKVGLAAKVIEVNRMHRPGWILQALINITVDGPLLLTPKTTALNVFISGFGVPIIAPHENVFRLEHVLVVGSCLFPFVTMSLSFGKLFFLNFPSSFPLTLTNHNLINKDSLFIQNEPTLALRYTGTTCERGRHE
jgi:hypothetical protein